MAAIDSSIQALQRSIRVDLRLLLDEKYCPADDIDLHEILKRPTNHPSDQCQARH